MQLKEPGILRVSTLTNDNTFYLLREVDSNGEDDHEDHTSKEAALILEGLGDCQKPLHGNDDQPHNGHGDGDVLDWVREVRNYGVVPMFLAHGNVTNNDIVNEEHQDQEGIYKCQDCQVWLEMEEYV